VVNSLVTMMLSMNPPKAGLRAAIAIALSLGAASHVSAAVYELTDAQQAAVGEDEVIVAVFEDTLYDLARRYGVGTEELLRVNPGIDPWLPGAGTKIQIPGRHLLPPGPREGIVVNLPEHRIYYYPKARRGKPAEVITYPVGIGKMDWRTPLGLTHVSQMEKNPTWRPPQSIRKEHALAGDPVPATVPPGPNNPLGLYAMRLAVGDGTYLIHGTNNPIAVGMPVTHGCVRMYPDDVAALFPLIRVGTPVRLVNEPVKVAWVQGEFLLEVHPPVDAEGQSTAPDLEQFSGLLREAVGEETVAVDWDYAETVLAKADGVIATVGIAATPPDAPPEVPPAKPPAPPSTAAEIEAAGR